MFNLRFSLFIPVVPGHYDLGDIFGFILPFSLIFNPTAGLFLKRFGFVAGLTGVSVLFVLWGSLCVIPVKYLQIATFILFIMYRLVSSLLWPCVVGGVGEGGCSLLLLLMMTEMRGGTCCAEPLPLACPVLLLLLLPLLLLLCRAYFFSITTAYVAFVFGYKTMGRLLGFANCFAAAVGGVQDPVIIFFGEQWYLANGLFAIPGLLSFALPMLLWYRARPGSAVLSSA